MRHHYSKYHQVTAWSLILLVLMTTLSFVVDTHYCEGELQNINVFGKAKPCQQASSKKSVYCPVHKKIMVMDETKDCCENKTIFIDNDDDQKESIFPISTIQQLEVFIIAYTSVFHSKEIADKHTIQKYAYQSPIISRDIYVLSEAFLL